MGVIDSGLRFSKAQAITASALGTTPLNGKAVKDWGRGGPIYLNVWLDVPFTTSANTLKIDLVSKVGSAPAAGDKVLEVMPARATSALLTVGLLVCIALPQDLPGEFLNVSYTASAALAAGAVTAWLSLGQGVAVKTTT
jgi:hypothetical protein